MADDYIGKKMEDYKRGVRSGAYRPKYTPAGSRPGYWTIKFPPCSVFVAGGTDPVGSAIIKTLRDAGCKVSFCDSDSRLGQEVAQTTGTQFLPADMGITAAYKRVVEYRGGVDVIINCLSEFPTELLSGFSERIINVNAHEPLPSEVYSLHLDAPAADIATIVTFLCTPAASHLFRNA